MIQRKARPKVGDVELALPTGRLSPSQVEMYLRCGLQYEFRYIQGLKEPPGVALIQGSSAHVALEQNNKHKIRTASDLPAKRVVECFNDTFSTRKSQIKNWQGLKEKQARQQVVTPLKNYMAEHAAAVTPIEVERKLLVNIGGVPVMVVIDLVDRALPADEITDAEDGVSDYKTTGRARSDADALNSVQLMSYAVAGGLRSGRFFSLVKGSKVQVTKRVKYVRRELRWLEEIYRYVAVSISRGVFAPADPGLWKCSPKWCGFWNRCRGKKR